MGVERLKLTRQPMGRAWYIRLPNGKLAKWPWGGLAAFEAREDAERAEAALNTEG